MLLSEAAATCHQGRSQWEIILHPGLKLQGLKSAASYPTQATKGIRTKSSGSHQAQSRTKAEIYCRGELVWDGWRAEKIYEVETSGHGGWKTINVQGLGGLGGRGDIGQEPKWHPWAKRSFVFLGKHVQHVQFEDFVFVCFTLKCKS